MGEDDRPHIKLQVTPDPDTTIPRGHTNLTKQRKPAPLCSPQSQKNTQSPVPISRTPESIPQTHHRPARQTNPIAWATGPSLLLPSREKVAVDQRST